MVLHELALFSGVGMLSEGVRAGLSYLGIQTRTVCHIEREAYAASVLVARMAEGSLDVAPIWSDVCTFDARAWCGAVDIVVGGFPCQDLSIAGKRVGLDGKRSGLFFEIIRIAADCGARFILLENVSAISSAVATVMDEAEGELDERAASRVVGELADSGWNAEWITLSASDVGASHGRARWFCLAWRMDDAECTERRQEAPAGSCGKQRDDGRRAEAVGRLGIAEQVLADAARHERDRPLREGGCRRGICEAGDAMVNTESQRTGPRHLPVGAQSQYSSTAAAVGRLGDTQSDRWNQGWTESSRQQGRLDVAESGLPMADSSGAGQQGNELGRACNGIWGGAGSIWIS